MIILIIFGDEYNYQAYVYFSPASCHFIPLGSKYSPQHSFENIPNLCSSLKVRQLVNAMPQQMPCKYPGQRTSGYLDAGHSSQVSSVIWQCLYMIPDAV
jgi:hypothetical protein